MRIFKVIMTCIMFLCGFEELFTPVNAEESTCTIYQLPQSRDIDSYVQIYNYLVELTHSIEFKILSYNPQSILDTSGFGRDWSQSFIGETTEWRDVGWANNQYANGVIFEDEDGYIYYSDSTGSDVSLSFSINHQVISGGVVLGQKTSGVAGYSLHCPANTPCKIWVRKYINVKLYHVVYSYEGQVHSEYNIPVKTELQLSLRNGLS